MSQADSPRVRWFGTVLALSCALWASPDLSPSTPASSVPMEQLKAFAETYWQIKQSYVDEVDDKKLIEGAIHGMLQSLDSYSGYLNEDALSDLQASSEGMYEGLGVEVVAENEQVLIVSTLDNSPAERAGLKANDVILAINQVDVASTGPEDAINSMRGRAGESIELTIKRLGQEHPLEFALVRETLELQSVKIKELNDGYWQISLSMFQRDTGYELSKRLRHAVAGKSVKGVVLDLRNNPGGVLRAAVDVADLMLSEGIIVSTEGRTAENKQRFYANPGDELEQIPMVVLINERSASASEIVAGALQDHGRAKVVGVKSYGKGVVQSVLPINQNAAIKLTTSRYYTPSGKSIHGTGIVPDLAVISSDDEPSKEDAMLKQALALLDQQTPSKLLPQ